MRKLLALATFVAALTAGAGTARACRWVRPPGPVITFPYRALTLGTVVRLGSDPQGATIRVDRIIDGRAGVRRLRTDRSPFALPCARTYEPHLGDRVFLVVLQTPAGPAIFSWLPLDVARLREPLVADWLAARSEAARRAAVTRWRTQHRTELPAP